ncbi:MAG: 2'-5' RNA ligase family protein [Bryobacteraceae bacterium]
MGCLIGEVSPVNAFALVSYIPGSLGRFLDGLRRELVVQCTAQSHLTVLPPRILEGRPDEGWSEIQEGLRNVGPVHVELRSIEIFPVSRAIYLSLGQGFSELERLHSKLNVGKLYFKEPFLYHPHITLAQDVPADRVDSIAELAASRWAEADVPRQFRMERLTFVQNGVGRASGCSEWIDLTTCDLGQPSEPWNWSDDGSLSRTSPIVPLSGAQASRRGDEAGSR